MSASRQNDNGLLNKPANGEEKEKSTVDDTRSSRSSDSESETDESDTESGGSSSGEESSSGDESSGSDSDAASSSSDNDENIQSACAPPPGAVKSDIKSTIETEADEAPLKNNTNAQIINSAINSNSDSHEQSQSSESQFDSDDRTYTPANDAKTQKVTSMATADATNISTGERVLVVATSASDTVALGGSDHDNFLSYRQEEAMPEHDNDRDVLKEPHQDVVAGEENRQTKDVLSENGSSGLTNSSGPDIVGQPHTDTIASQDDRGDKRNRKSSNADDKDNDRINSTNIQDESDRGTDSRDSGVASESNSETTRNDRTEDNTGRTDSSPVEDKKVKENDQQTESDNLRDNSPDDDDSGQTNRNCAENESDHPDFVALPHQEKLSGTENEGRNDPLSDPGQETLTNNSDDIVRLPHEEFVAEREDTPVQKERQKVNKDERKPLDNNESEQSDKKKDSPNESVREQSPDPVNETNVEFVAEREDTPVQKERQKVNKDERKPLDNNESERKPVGKEESEQSVKKKDSPTESAREQSPEPVNEKNEARKTQENPTVLVKDHDDNDIVALPHTEYLTGKDDDSGDTVAGQGTNDPLRDNRPYGLSGSNEDDILHRRHNDVVAAVDGDPVTRVHSADKDNIRDNSGLNSPVEPVEKPSNSIASKPSPKKSPKKKSPDKSEDPNKITKSKPKDKSEKPTKASTPRGTKAELKKEKKDSSKIEPKKKTSPRNKSPRKDTNTALPSKHEDKTPKEKVDKDKMPGPKEEKPEEKKQAKEETPRQSKEALKRVKKDDEQIELLDEKTIIKNFMGIMGKNVDEQDVNSGKDENDVAIEAVNQSNKPQQKKEEKKQPQQTKEDTKQNKELTTPRQNKEQKDKPRNNKEQTDKPQQNKKQPKQSQQIKEQTNPTVQKNGKGSNKPSNMKNDDIDKGKEEDGFWDNDKEETPRKTDGTKKVDLDSVSWSTWPAVDQEANSDEDQGKDENEKNEKVTSDIEDKDESKMGAKEKSKPADSSSPRDKNDEQQDSDEANKSIKDEDNKEEGDTEPEDYPDDSDGQEESTQAPVQDEPGGGANEEVDDSAFWELTGGAPKDKHSNKKSLPKATPKNNRSNRNKPPPVPKKTTKSPAAARKVDKKTPEQMDNKDDSKDRKTKPGKNGRSSSLPPGNTPREITPRKANSSLENIQSKDNKKKREPDKSSRLPQITSTATVSNNKLRVNVRAPEKLVLPLINDSRQKDKAINIDMNIVVTKPPKKQKKPDPKWKPPPQTKKDMPVWWAPPDTNYPKRKHPLAPRRDVGPSDPEVIVNRAAWPEFKVKWPDKDLKHYSDDDEDV